MQSLKDGAQWLNYTYLYTRMRQNPALYGVPLDASSTDPYLLDRRMDIVHTAATILDKHNLIKYDRRTGGF